PGKPRLRSEGFAYRERNKGLKFVGLPRRRDELHTMCGDVERLALCLNRSREIAFRVSVCMDVPVGNWTLALLWLGSAVLRIGRNPGHQRLREHAGNLFRCGSDDRYLGGHESSLLPVPVEKGKGASSHGQGEPRCARGYVEMVTILHGAGLPRFRGPYCQVVSLTPKSFHFVNA